MLGLLIAEWRKISRNYLVTSFLVWVYPVGMAAWIACLLLASLVSKHLVRNMVGLSSGFWTMDMIGIWAFVTSFPVNVLGRMPVVAFMAVVFGGEYQWGTWRNIVPRNHRAALIIAKLLNASVIVVIAFAATSIITVIGYAAGYAIVDLPYAPSVTISAAFESLQTYAEQALLGFLSLLILADFAALAAVLTRSLLGSLVAGIGLAAVEPMTLLLLVAFGRLIDQPDIVKAYQIAPTFHISNAESWFLRGEPVAPYFAELTSEPTLITSLLVVFGWVVALAFIAIIAFRRQDITC